MPNIRNKYYCLSLSDISIHVIIILSLFRIDVCISGEIGVGNHFNLHELESAKRFGEVEIPNSTLFSEVLSVGEHSFITLNLTKAISSDQGTISFWFKNNWNAKDESHTILSMRWDSKVESYLSISYGWWEPLGTGHLYFVLSNYDEMYCSVPYYFESNEWFYVAVTWGKDGGRFCNIFIDGDLYSQKKSKDRNISYKGNAIFIGSDKGSLDRRGRYLNADIADLQITSAVTEKAKIKLAYKKYIELDKLNILNKESWFQLSVCQKVICKENALKNKYIFDESGNWALSKDYIDKRISRIKKAGFNHYVVNVWHGAGTRYPSAIAKMEDKIENNYKKSGFDPLEYLIERAHKEGIKVHIWFTVARRETELYMDYYDKGTPKNAYNVHLDSFREFIVNLMLEAVRKYNIDGVNLDYIRTMGICISKYCEADYREATGRSLSNDVLNKYSSKSARKSIQRWQDNAVEAIVSKFYKEAKEIKNNIIVSVDAHPSAFGEVRPLQGRDSMSWLAKGYIDTIFAMDYNRKLDYLKTIKIIGETNKPIDLVPLIANYDLVNGIAVPRSGNYINKYVNFVSRNYGETKSIGFHLYNQLTNDQIIHLKNNHNFK